VKKPVSIKSLLVLPLFFLCVLFLLETAGGRARRFVPAGNDGGIRIAVLGSTPELYRYWKRLGITGRIVVHAGRYLHYVDESGGAMGYTATRTYPVTIMQRKDDIEKKLNYANFLRVAVQTNLARALYMVMPVDVFNSRFASDADFPERGTGIIRTHDFGTPRTIVTVLPDLKERVVLNIDATYLSGPNGKNGLDRLLKGAAAADVITFCLSGDNPDVQEHERTAAMNLLEAYASASNGRVTLVKKTEGLF